MGTRSGSGIKSPVEGLYRRIGQPPRRAQTLSTMATAQTTREMMSQFGMVEILRADSVLVRFDVPMRHAFTLRESQKRHGALPAGNGAPAPDGHFQKGFYRQPPFGQ